MATSAEVDRVYVQCTAYCGARVYNPGLADHHEDCGITAGELVILDAELKAAKVRHAAEASVATEDEADGQVVSAERLRCSCGRDFGSWDEIATHQDGTSHQGMWQEDRVIEGAVDGEPSRIVLRSVPVAASADPPEWDDPEIDSEWVYEFQARVDNGSFNVGGAGKKCLGKGVFDGVELACPHKPILKVVRVNVCEFGKHKQTLEEMCLIHAVLAKGGHINPVGNGPLFAD